MIIRGERVPKHLHCFLKFCLWESQEVVEEFRRYVFAGETLDCEHKDWIIQKVLLDFQIL